MIMCPDYCCQCDASCEPADNCCSGDCKRNSNDPRFIVPAELDRARAFALVGLLREVNFSVDEDVTRVYLGSTGNASISPGGTFGFKCEAVNRGAKRFMVNKYVAHLQYITSIVMANAAAIRDCIVDESVDSAIASCDRAGGYYCNKPNAVTKLQSMVNVITALKAKLVPTSMNDPADYNVYGRDLKRRITLSNRSARVLEDLSVATSQAIYELKDRDPRFSNKIDRNLILDAVEILLLFSGKSYREACMQRINYEYMKHSDFAVTKMDSQSKWLHFDGKMNRYHGPRNACYRLPDNRVVCIFDQLKHMSADGMCCIGNLFDPCSYWYISKPRESGNSGRTSDAVETYLWYELAAQIYKREWDCSRDRPVHECDGNGKSACCGRAIR